MRLRRENLSIGHNQRRCSLSTPGWYHSNRCCGSCAQIAHTTGLEALSKAGLTLADIEHSTGAHRRFLRGCHYGYDRAQRRVGEEFIALELQAREAQARLKELRRSHDAQYRDFTELIRVLRHRQLVLRRLIDSILFTMLVPNEWVLRHFRLSDQIHPIDPVVLRKTIEMATERNREERLRFSIVSDLTTAVQIGDLIEIDRSSLTGRSWRIIELKTGRVNEILSSLIEQRQGVISNEDRDVLQNSLGPKAVKQVTRMLAQQDRQRNLETLVETDRGVSPRFGMHTQVFPDIIEVEDYAIALDSVCTRARSSGVGAARVSGCLSLFAISAEQLARTDFGAVKHSLYHLSNPSAACELRNEAAAPHELSEVRKLRPVFDLVQVNLHSMEGRPVFLWAQENRAIDLAVGRTRLFAHFDMEAFFRLAANHGVRLTWVTSPPRGAEAKLAVQIPGGPPGAWGVRATLPGGEDQLLLSGFFGRVIVSLTDPKELIALIKRAPMQATRIGMPLTQADSGPQNSGGLPS